MIKAATLLALGTLAFKIGRAILPYQTLFHKSNQINTIHNKYIIITGCTDGIGKQYAKYCTKLGIPLVLIAKNQSKLNSINQQLIQMSPTNSDINRKVVIDYSHQNLTLGNYLTKINDLQLSSKSVAGIINCCGVAVLQKYSQISWQEMQRVKRVNTVSLQLALKNMAFQCMIQNPFIINVSSHTACYPLAYSSVYSAAKAYCSNLLQAYSKQNKNSKVLSVQPWYVKTKMVGYQNSWDTVDPSEIVNGSLQVLGKQNRCSGCVKHQLLYQFSYFMQKYNDQQVQQKYARIEKVKALKNKRLKRQQNNKSQQSKQGKDK